MSVYKSVDLGNRGSAVAGAAVDVSAIPDLSVSVTGTFVATLKLMISLDGTEYMQHGADITAAALVTDVPACKKVRLDCSAWTSGTAKGRGGGLDTNR